MEIRGTQIVVAAVPVVVVAMIVMIMLVAVVMPSREQKSAHDIHDKADDGDNRRFAEQDRSRLEQTSDGFHADANGEKAQNERGCKPCQIADLAGAEAVSGVVRVTACVAVGCGRDPKGSGVGEHMYAVRQQGH